MIAWLRRLFAKPPQRAITLRVVIAADQPLPPEVWRELAERNYTLLFQSLDLIVDDPRVNAVPCTVLLGQQSFRRTIHGPWPKDPCVSPS